MNLQLSSPNLSVNLVESLIEHLTVILWELHCLMHAGVTAVCRRVAGGWYKS